MTFSYIFPRIPTRPLKAPHLSLGRHDRRVLWMQQRAQPPRYEGRGYVQEDLDFLQPNQKIQPTRFLYFAGGPLGSFWKKTTWKHLN